MEPTTIDNIVAAADVSGLLVSVEPLLIAAIGITMAFVAFRLVRKGANSVK